MSSIFKLFSKKDKSQTMIKRIIEETGSISIKHYFGNDSDDCTSSFLEEGESPVTRILKDKRKKEKELKKQLFISWSKSRKKVHPNHEDFESYLSIYERIKEFYPSEGATGYFADTMWPIAYIDSNLYESKEKISNSYDEEFRTFLLQTLKSVNRHLAHEMKQACSQGRDDKRNKFRTFCRINIKSLDDADSSIINTHQHSSINFKQNYNGTRKYKWAS